VIPQSTSIMLKVYSSLSGMVKLSDANNAGGKNASKCTLILTEGDSAKNLAMAGLSVVGRDNFGVFPLRGKLLNVREAKHEQIMKNEEIQSIKKILGLQHGKVYTSTDSLRYGSVMIMTDQVGYTLFLVYLYSHPWLRSFRTGLRWFSHQRLDYQFPRLLLPLAPEVA
jgi:DNA gyrase/topoisomerase IV subunit B